MFKVEISWHIQLVGTTKDYLLLDLKVKQYFLRRNNFLMMVIHFNIFAFF